MDWRAVFCHHWCTFDVDRKLRCLMHHALLCHAAPCVLCVVPASGVDSEPGSPTACFSSQPAAEVSSPVLTGPRSARRAGRTPVSAVRESIPLFMSDPSRALGSNLLVEDSLDDQDMQMLTSGTAAGAAAAAGAAGAAAAAAGRLLALGGPQRVALGFSGGLNPLTPVAEGFGTSPIPEE